MSEHLLRDRAKANVGDGQCFEPSGYFWCCVRGGEGIRWYARKRNEAGRGEDGKWQGRKKGKQQEKEAGKGAGVAGGQVINYWLQRCTH